MMGRVEISQQAVERTTSVSNVFIDEYMTDANDAQIKIYLYLLRMMGAGLPTNVMELADRFNLTDSDVMRALRFWEKKELIHLEYNESRHLTGIHVETLIGNTVNIRSTASTSPQVMPFPGNRSARAAANVPEVDVTAQTRVIDTEAVQAALQEMPAQAQTATQAAQAVPAAQAAQATPAAPAMDKIPAPAQEEQIRCREILYIAEQYYQRPLNPQEIRTVLYISEDLHFSDALIDYLLQYCIGKGKTDSRYMQKVAQSWAENNITTPQQAEADSNRHDKRVYEICRWLGIDNTPTDAETDYFTRWIFGWGFSQQMIQEACNRTVLRTQNNRIPYADGILKRWHDNGISTMEQVAAADAGHADARKSSGNGNGTGNGASAKAAGSWEQNEYDFAAIEKSILGN